MRAKRIVAGLVAMAAVAAGLSAGTAAAKPAAQSEHDRIVAFWTNERVAKAIPRDFVYDPATKRFTMAGKPGGGGSGGSTTVLGASYTGGGAVLKTTGKVLFALGTSYYVCSASVVKDASTSDGRSIILTAGHCVYDETNKVWATNWMFIPDYDSSAVDLTTNGSFCAQTTLGCWTASSLVASSGFTTAGSFNDQAIVHDFAFAVVGDGGKSGGQLDAAVPNGGQGIAFQSYPAGTDSWLFGYPAAQKYKGKDLTYCRGPLGFDPNAGNATYRVGCDMTGGSSGGPWLTDFRTATGLGTLMSLNSYGYSGVTAMHGPKFTSETAAMFGTATSIPLGQNSPS